MRIPIVKSATNCTGSQHFTSSVGFVIVYRLWWKYIKTLHKNIRNRGRRRLFVPSCLSCLSGWSLIWAPLSSTEPTYIGSLKIDQLQSKAWNFKLSVLHRTAKKMCTLTAIFHQCSHNKIVLDYKQFCERFGEMWVFLS